MGERKLVFLAHYNRFFGTHFFAESAENTAQHVNLELYRVAFLHQFRFGCLHFNGKRGAHARTQTARYAPLHPVLLYEYRSAAERCRWVPLFLGILARKLFPKNLRQCDLHPHHDLRNVEPLPPMKVFAVYDRFFFRCVHKFNFIRSTKLQVR